VEPTCADTGRVAATINTARNSEYRSTTERMSRE
jgi:hypothetical protein